MADKATEPTLAKPGAGLPFFEWFLARYVLLPRWLKTPREQATDHFLKESKKILELAKSLNGDELVERRLIKRLPGLEDSSRFWSVAMTMEHLVIVGGAMLEIIRKLANGITDIPAVGTADVKPHSEVDVQRIIEEFEAMTDAWSNVAKTEDFGKFPDAKYAHPWFGPLTAAQWLVFAPIHQRLHRRQIEEIIKQLKS